MRVRAGYHGVSAAARVFTLAVIAAMWLAQFGSLSHELTVRHVRCAEHGELTHVPISAAAPVTAHPMSSEPAVQGRPGDSVDAHEHCGLAFTLEGSEATPIRNISGVLPPPPPVPAPPAPCLQSGRTVALSAAPKTSPPRT